MRSDSDSDNNESETANTRKKAKVQNDQQKTDVKSFAFGKSAAEENGTTERKPHTFEREAPAPSTEGEWLHNKLDFLKPEKIRDANKNRPGEPNYDERTLYVPEDFLNKQTPAMRQWWILKSKHFDSVLFFKVGKFYELYHMDAVVGVNHLGFSYMKVVFLIKRLNQMLAYFFRIARFYVNKINQ